MNNKQCKITSSNHKHLNTCQSAIHITKYSIIKLLVSLFLAASAVFVLAVNPTNLHQYSSIPQLLVSSLDNSSKSVITACIIFIFLFSLLFLSINKYVTIPKRIKIVSLLTSAVLSWTWTIPGYPSDGYKWPDLGTNAWSSTTLLTFYLFKWLILTIALTFIISVAGWRITHSPVSSGSSKIHKQQITSFIGQQASHLLGNLGFDLKHISILSAIIFACWIPVLLINSPAQIFVDTVGELLMFRTPAHVPLPGFRLNGVWIDDQHPAFDTLIFGAIDNIGRACGNELAAFIVFTWLQSIALAFAIGTLFCWVNTWTKTPQILKLLILFIICFGGLFPMTSSVIMKDSLWLPLFIAWVTAFAEIVSRALSDRPIGWGLVCAVILTSILAGLTKKTSIYITTISLLVPAFIPHCRQRMRLLLSALLSPVLVLVLVPTCIYRPLNISSGNPAEALAVPMQQITNTAIDHPTDISPQDSKVINRVMDLSAARRSFTPQTAVPIKPAYKRGKVSREDAIRFLGVWAKLGLKHPRSYVSAVPYLWDAFVPGRIMVDGLYPIREGWPELTQKVVLPSIPDHAFSWQQKHLAPILYNGMRAIPPWNLICDVSFYVLDIPLFGLYTCIIKRQYRQLVFLVPAFLNILVQLVIQTAEPRLSLGMLALFPLSCVTAWI